MPEAFPSYLPTKFQRIHLELTNRCNFSCTFCPDCIMTRERGLMSESLACSTLDQIADLDLAEKVTFHVMGEPLLHPQLFSILDHAVSRKLPVGLTTNGALLSPPTIQKLAERDLYQIDISLQTPDAESFRATRGTRMDFEKYPRGIARLIGSLSRTSGAADFQDSYHVHPLCGQTEKRSQHSRFYANIEPAQKPPSWNGLSLFGSAWDFHRFPGTF